MSYEPTPGTYGYLWVEGYTVTAYCTPCNRVVKVDLETMPAEQTYINRRWWCRYCHGLGQANLSPDHSPRDSPAAKRLEIEKARRREDFFPADGRHKSLREPAEMFFCDYKNLARAFYRRPNKSRMMGHLGQSCCIAPVEARLRG